MSQHVVANVVPVDSLTFDDYVVVVMKCLPMYTYSL